MQADIRVGWVWTAFTLTVALMFHRLILGDVLFWGLPSLQFYPWRWFAFQELRDGQIPYWNPYNGAGAPLIANYQSAIFYPPNLLFLVLPGAQTMGLIALLHIFGSAYGMWKFGAVLNMSTFGRAVSMLSFALGSYIVGRIGSFPTAQAAAWIPWLFWATHRLIEQRTSDTVGILGLIVGLQLMAGHAQTTWYALLALGFYALWYTFFQLRVTTWQARFEALMLSLVAMVLGLGLAAWQLFLTLEFLGQSQRSGGVDYETLTNLSYAPLRSITLLFPNFFGTPADGSYLTPGRGVYFEDAAYIGVIPFFAAIFAIIGWVKWRNLLTHHQVFRTVPFWVVLGAVGFVLALGKFTIIYRFLYDNVPTFDNFREPVRWLIWPAFACSILAGIGVHNWERSNLALFWTRLAAAGSFMLVVASLGGYLYLEPSIDDPETLWVLAEALIAFGCWVLVATLLTLQQPASNISVQWWQLAVLVAIAADLSWATWGLNPTAPDEFYTRDYSISAPEQGRLYWFEDYEETVKFETYFDLSDYQRATDRWTDVRTSLLPNLNMLDRVDTLNNFDPLQPAFFLDYIDLIENAGEASGALLRGAGVSMVYGDVQPIGWETGRNENTHVAPQSASLVWAVPTAIWVERDEDAKAQLISSTWNPEEVVILQEHDMSELSEPTLTQANVQTVRNDPTRREYRVTSNGAGFLVMAHTWYPGWEVRVNGDMVDLYRANLAFMAVPIDEGDNEITITYAPRGNEVALAISVLSVLILLSLVAVGLFNDDEQQRLAA